jgi:hypothetical protein
MIVDHDVFLPANLVHHPRDREHLNSGVGGFANGSGGTVRFPGTGGKRERREQDKEEPDAHGHMIRAGRVDRKPDPGAERGEAAHLKNRRLAIRTVRVKPVRLGSETGDGHGCTKNAHA